jgi:hypothetical protein
MGRIENKEDSALVARRLDDARFGPPPLGCVPLMAGECERDWKGLMDDTEAKGCPEGGGVLERVDDGGGKNERFALGILRTKGEESEVRGSGCGPGAVVGIGTISSSPSALCANNEATVSRSA